MHDCSWKDIMVGYRRVNQWKIYNLKTRKIYISASVCFNKSFSYYDTGHIVIDKDEDSVELDDI